MRLIAAFLLIATFFPLSGQAGILCARNAKAVPVDPVFENKNDRCDGSVKVQAISYKCGSEAEAAFVMRSFLNDLQEEGEKICAQFCRKRGKNCISEFSKPTKCGFSVPLDQISEVGEAAPCGDRCEGKNFIYCSIYHGSYLRYEAKFLKDKKPNCVCRKRTTR